MSKPNVNVKSDSKITSTYCCSWRAPSNIALIKYWGKWGRQLPMNPSLSFSLKHSCIEFDTCIETPADFTTTNPKLKSLLVDGKEIAKFSARIEKFLASTGDLLPELAGKEISIISRASFPHSTGIASSAASMAALALSLCSFQRTEDDLEFFRRASLIARLASGSACRSVYGGAVLWGRCEDDACIDEESSDEYAIPLSSEKYLAPLFRNMKDAILIVDSTPKKVSSSAGHQMMIDHPYREARVVLAHENLHKILLALKSGDAKVVAEIVEMEALGLHGLMMSSMPSYLLVRPNTIHIIERVRELRERESLPIFFTLDAGPNVHLLYPQELTSKIKAFVAEELLRFCEGGEWIDDEVGSGPLRL
ncbi:MAG: diphosphomevalonate decarboxylase [Oligoflexia bacterium]|nr:diphosphomevalonate decarboxylase [Oligoflexia bacterium]MBF0366223.1 diphosphomevalonate decarboxylase [Oligoflexia bacterium]